MKRILLSVSVVVSLCISCTKQTDDPDNPSSPIMPTLSKHAAFGDQTVRSGPIKLNEHVVKTGTINDLWIAFDIAIEGTLSRSNLKNYYYIVREKNDTAVIVEQSSPTQTVPAVVQTQFIDGLKKNTEYLVTQYATVSPGSIGTIRTTVSMEYDWPEANMSQWISNVMGQTITVTPYKAMPTVSADAVTMQTTNGAQAKYTLKADIPSGSTIALKQLAWRVSYADNGTNDTLQVNDVSLWLNDQSISSLGMFVDSLGMPVDSLSELTVAHRKLFFVFNAGVGELSLSGTNFLELRYTIDGLGPTADGDAVRIIAIKDDAAPTVGWNYLNLGTVGSHSKLYNVPTAHSSAKSYNFIWSDLSSTGHSGIFGFSSNDWYNSYHLTWNVAPAIYHSRGTGW